MRTSALSKSARDLQPSVFAQLTPKINELGDRCIPLHIGDTYRLPPEAALDAIRALAQNGLSSTRYFKYSHPFGRAELLEELTLKLERDNGIKVGTSCLQVTCGATQALCAVAQTFLDPNDEIVVLCPHWPLIRGIVKTVGGRVVDAPFAEAVADPDTVLGPLLSERTKAIYFANPNNPDGQLLSRVEAERLYRFAALHDLYLWSDEAYEHIVFDGREKVSIAEFDNDVEKRRVMSVFTFSKSFGMAGMRVGYVVGPTEVMSCLRRVSTHQIYDLSDLNQEVVLAALRQPRADYQSYLKAQQEEYQKARDLLHSAFPNSPLSPGGAYLFVPFESQKAAWAHLLAWLEGGVSSAPGEAFGSLHPHCLRLCFTATPFARLEEAVSIIRQIGPQ
jgi:aspartate aminotransferase